MADGRRAIPVADRLRARDLHPAAFVTSRFVNGRTSEVVFTLAKAAFEKRKDRGPMALRVGAINAVLDFHRKRR